MTTTTRTEQKRLDTALYVTLGERDELLVLCRAHLADQEPTVIRRARQVLVPGLTIHTCQVCQPPHAGSHR